MTGRALGQYIPGDEAVLSKSEEGAGSIASVPLSAVSTPAVSMVDALEANMWDRVAVEDVLDRAVTGSDDAASAALVSSDSR